jgi:cysteine desulfurase
MMEQAYFDNSATTMVDPRVVEAMLPYFTEKYGNASSLHSFGRDAYDAMETAREQTAKAIGSAARDIIFTSGGTESDNLAIQGVAFASTGKGRHLITSAVEHHAVLHACQFLETQGFKVTYLPARPSTPARPPQLPRRARMRRRRRTRSSSPAASRPCPSPA